MIPAIEPSEVGTTGLIWLFLSYGYVLYYASNLISEGSDLLLLVPSLAGLVGGVVLPLLGAVPDGAIMFFSGIGPIEDAQETLSVGVGALAGSTIMLLTVPWALSVYGGRVDIVDGEPQYLAKPKLTPKANLKDELNHTGVSVTEAVKHGAIIMAITTIPYFLIQIPAMYLHGPSEEVAEGEKYWALAGLIVCIVGFVSYLTMQFNISRKGMDKGKRVAVVKKLLQEGEVSLCGALAPSVEATGKGALAAKAAEEYQAVGDGSLYPPPAVADYLKEILLEAFMKYDTDRNGTLDKAEVRTFFQDFHENISDEDMDELFAKFDTDHSGDIGFDEFIGACYVFITDHNKKSVEGKQAKKVAPAYSQARRDSRHESIVQAMFQDTQEEEEEIPEELVDLDPDQQQAAIKRKAFLMLFIGTALVIIFSDPMVDVMQEIAFKLNLSPFYVSFILAPLASNASEVIASQYYAAKKTRKTITVSLTALEGAASMNNTFCLSIFMGLIFFRGLAWQYTAETIAIILVEFIIACMAQKRILTTFNACIIMAVFPLSIAFVATLEAFGID